MLSISLSVVEEVYSILLNNDVNESYIKMNFISLYC